MQEKLLQSITFFILLTLFTFIFFYSPAVAGTIGNPTATLEEGIFAIGFDYEILKRDIEDEDSVEYEVESSKYFIKGAYGINDKFNFHLNLGMADVTADDIELETDQELSYGGGLNVTVHEQNNLKIGFSFQFAQISGEDDKYLNMELFPGEYIRAEATVDWLEYDLAFGASYSGTENFIFYGGICFSKVDGETEFKDKSTFDEDEFEDYLEELDYEEFIEYLEELEELEDELDALEIFEGKWDIEEADAFGIFIGGTYNFTPQFSIGLEARILNQESFSFLLNYAFL